jgi:hypothetical protein
MGNNRLGKLPQRRKEGRTWMETRRKNCGKTDTLEFPFKIQLQLSQVNNLDILKFPPFKIFPSLMFKSTATQRVYFNVKGKVWLLGSPHEDGNVG